VLTPSFLGLEGVYGSSESLRQRQNREAKIHGGTCIQGGKVGFQKQRAFVFAHVTSFSESIRNAPSPFPRQP
jgi:hypothetical protein